MRGTLRRTGGFGRRSWPRIGAFLLTWGAGAAPSMAAAEDSSGCRACHVGIEEMHPEAELSCVECHGGDGEARRKREAHVPAPGGRSAGPGEHVAGLDEDLAWRRFRNPMDLRVVDKTCAECHPALVEHLESSLHGTTAGHLSDGFYEVGAREDKGSAFAVFGRRRGPEQEGEVERLTGLPEFVRRSGEQSLAVHYPDLVRKECMQCHLYSAGQALRGRTGFDGDYRGEGCAACHVAYARDGLSRSQDAEALRLEPGHPRSHSMTRAPATETCTTCHNGDASIGMQFRGLSQLPPRAVGGPDVPGTTDTLLHREYFLNDPALVPADAHHAAGMHCIDCHTLDDVMGDGALHGKMEDAVEITCTACHGTFDAPATLRTERDRRLRHLVRRDGSVFLRSKVTGKEHRVVQVADVLDPASPDFNPEAAAAMTSEHADVECYTCHSAWNPNFLGFHFYRNEGLTQLDLVSGRRTAGRVTTQEKVFATWKSFYAGRNEAGRVAPYLTGFSSMGTVDDADGRRVLEQRMPVTARGLSGMAMIHHQMHSVRSTARQCVECHRSPATWGLGSPNFRLARRLAFVADRRGIEVIGLTPEQLDSSVPLAKFVLPDVVDLALEVDGLQGHARFLYASEGARGIHVLDLEDPLHPERVAFVASPSPRGLALAGDRLYCADGWAGLAIYDVSTPAEIRLLGRVPTFDAHEVQIAWPHAYVADGTGGLAIVDVRDASRPRVVGGLQTRSVTAAVPAGESQVIDLRLLFQNSRPRVDDGGRPAATRSGARLLCTLLDASKGPILVDVTEARRPRVLWPQDFTGASPFPVTPSVEYRGLALRSHVDLPGPQGGARIAERDYLYVLQETRRGTGAQRSSLYVVDVSDPAEAEVVADLPVGAATEMLVPASIFSPPFLQSLLFAAGSGGVAILDLSTSRAPVAQGSLTRLTGAYAVAVEEFPLDRMLDESGRELKDVSHPGSRWLTIDEIEAILTVPGERLGTLDREVRAAVHPGEDLRRVLMAADSDGNGWLSGEEIGQGHGGEDLDGNGVVSLRELARARAGWGTTEVASGTEGIYLETRVDRDGDLSRLLDGVRPEDFDRNDDRRLDRRETEAAFFAALDLNRDGRLHADELSRHPGPMRRMRYGVFDGLTRKGWKGVAEGRAIGLREFALRDEDWEALDADGDGAVQLPVPLQPERQRRGILPPPPEWPTRRPDLVGLPPGLTEEALLAAFDRDGDRSLSRRELAGRPDLYQQLDRNGDGKASEEEWGILLGQVADGDLDRCFDAFEARWDLDGDGKLAPSELAKDWPARLRDRGH